MIDLEYFEESVAHLLFNYNPTGGVHPLTKQQSNELALRITKFAQEDILYSEE